MNGLAICQETFLFPDSPLAPLPECVRFSCARNETRGLQLLLEAHAPSARITLEDAPDALALEVYELLDVPVEYNTGDGVEQGGAMVISPKACPPYAIRRAPFRVYDCLLPRTDGCVAEKDGRIATYVCLRPDAPLPASKTACTLLIQNGAHLVRLRIEMDVYDVLIPPESFHVINWYSEAAISRFHHTTPGTDAHAAMRARYAAAMRRARQTDVLVSFSRDCLVSREPVRFDFSRQLDQIKTFKQAGIAGLTLGGLLSRGTLPDGKPDMYTDQFRCALAPEIPFESPEGYALTVRFLQAVYAFLCENGWEKNVIFQIHDEPDVHYRGTLDARRRQYYLAASLLRKHIPGVRIAEAVKSAAFAGGIDIWVPVTSGYEEQREAFERLQALGEEVWSYVCCGPQGFYLNRFLDSPLLRPRLLFWGFAAYGISGYLHWGFNQFPASMNPFEATSCKNDTGIGTNFPCGDAFIVYPGEDGPLLSMRLEAQRRGAQDAELLRLLQAKNPQAAKALIARVFRSNCEYCADPEAFEAAYAALLEAL